MEGGKQSTARSVEQSCRGGTEIMQGRGGRSQRSNGGGQNTLCNQERAVQTGIELQGESNRAWRQAKEVRIR